MGNRRVVLFGVALAALFSIDAAAAASKGASRTSNRRSVVEHGGRPSRTYRYRDEEGAQEHDGLKDGGKIGSKRTKSNRGKDRSSSGSSRLSPRSSSSRSSSRLILAVVSLFCAVIQKDLYATHPQTESDQHSALADGDEISRNVTLVVLTL